MYKNITKQIYKINRKKKKKADTASKIIDK